MTIHSIGSVVPGLRDYDVAVQEPGGGCITVDRVRGQFHARRRLVAFVPRRVVAVRISVGAVNFGGLAGGLPSWFWPTEGRVRDDPGSAWYGPAVVEELEVFAGS